MTMTELLEKAVVNHQYSRNYYPKQTFGRLATKGMELITKEVLPYLQHQLERAVSDRDNYKIQVYIRAIGNLGHVKILSVFEPYLEGKQQITNFERMSMIVAMNKLAINYPKDAQAVLYKIYQNVAEAHEVRCAAVLQLMRTKPDAALLQRMAEFTNVDTNNQVKAAVKTAIQSAAQLQNPENIEL